MNTPVSLKVDKLLLEKGIDMPVSPTIADVVMWLYKKHGIRISVDGPHKLLKSWCFEVYKINGDITLNKSSNFNSLTEAYEAAIEYTLNELI